MAAPWQIGKQATSMKLAMVLPSLTGGGMERMRLNLLSEWLRAGVAVDLVVANARGQLLDSVPDTVRVFEVAAGGPLYFYRGFLRYLNEQRPTHVLVAGYDIAALVLLAASGRGEEAPVIVISVHSNSSAEAHWGTLKQRLKLRLSFRLIRLLLSRCHGVVAVSKGIADDLETSFHFPRGKLHVIPNPVLTDETFSYAAEPLQDAPVEPGKPWILFAGRLEYEKGLDVLLAAFSTVAQQSNADLVLLGEGALRESLRCMASRQGFEGRMHIRPFQNNPFPFIREASVLVLPSRFEGFGNVLIEAMSCGTQVVATDCPNGPAEILQNGRYGQLVPVGDAEALASALLDSLDGRFHVEPAALHGYAQQFTAVRSAGEYLNVLTATPEMNTAEGDS